MKHLKLFFCLVIFIGLYNFSSCIKDKQDNFPYVPINFSINLLTDPEYIMLQAPNNAQLITYSQLGFSTLGYGNNGVIVYNAGTNEFYAFDATCPYDLPDINAVDVSETDGVAICPKCASRYVLPGLGMPTVKGPAVYPLHEYQSYYNANTGILIITN